MKHEQLTPISNPHHDMVEAIDVVIAAIKRKHESQHQALLSRVSEEARRAKYEQIGIETSKFYHTTGMMPFQVKEELAEPDMGSGFTDVRGWY